MPQVTTIPATINRFTTQAIGQPTKRRVAGYARVSTDSDEQFTSYEAQIDYYTSFIQAHEGWEFVDVYTDEGISGTNTKRREGFRRMIADALDGRIDLIVTKSVSRFARNTVDSLSTIRKLKEKGAECYFEKENIWTFDGKGELLITIMSSLAQEESRSISENCVWGQRKRFSDGKVTVPFGHFLGYDRGDDGNLIVNPEQAALVRRIYGMFLTGMTPHSIAKQLTDEGIPSPAKKAKWNACTIARMLTNEKYKGDALLQKTFTVDFLTKKKKVNEGEIPQYYVTGNHEAIIEPAVFDMVQREMESRHPGKNRYSGVHVFSGKVYCGECGSQYGSKVWHSNDRYRRVIWQCNHKYDNSEKCSTPHFDEITLQRLFISAVNKLLIKRKAVIANFALIEESLFGTVEIERQRAMLQNELTVIAELEQKCILENATVALDQSDYQKRYNEIARRFSEAKAKVDALDAEIREKQTKRKSIERFIQTIKEQPMLIDSFDPILWRSLVDRVTIYSHNDVRFTFMDGTVINA